MSLNPILFVAIVIGILYVVMSPLFLLATRNRFCETEIEFLNTFTVTSGYPARSAQELNMSEYPWPGKTFSRDSHRLSGVTVLNLLKFKQIH